MFFFFFFLLISSAFGLSFALLCKHESTCYICSGNVLKMPFLELSHVMRKLVYSRFKIQDLLGK